MPTWSAFANLTSDWTVRFFSPASTRSQTDAQAALYAASNTPMAILSVSALFDGILGELPEGLPASASRVL